ncbi:hypothetical protein B0H14DRAFT_2899475 [Mycena olivaceomarginata]|nr:hypothetical protein B0H14DRAFT_2899475 [Mycena olivaceomarginata]
MERWNQLNIVMGAPLCHEQIYRCYCIWGFRMRIIVVPIVLLVATGCLGYASVIACGLEGFSEFLFINWFFPLAVVFSLARIWWIARGARAYRTVIAMILESGALYCTPGLLYLIFFAIRPSSTQVIFAALAQVICCRRTLQTLMLVSHMFVVRVGLGNAVDGVDSFRSVVDIRAETEADVDGLDLLGWDQDPDDLV